MAKLWCLARDGALYCAKCEDWPTSKLIYYNIHTAKKVCSIMECNGTREVKVKYEDGEIGIIDKLLKKFEDKANIKLVRDIYRENVEYTVSINEGVIQIAEYYVTSEIAVKISFAKYVGGNYGIKIYFKDGATKRFTPQVRCGKMGIIAEDGEFHYIEGEEKLYCIYGEMTELSPIGEIVSVPTHHIVKAETGELFVFNKFIGRVQRLLYCGDHAIYINGRNVSAGYRITQIDGSDILKYNNFWIMHKTLNLPYRFRSIFINLQNVKSVSYDNWKTETKFKTESGEILECASYDYIPDNIRLEPCNEWHIMDNDMLLIYENKAIYPNCGNISRYGDCFVNSFGREIQTYALPYKFPLESAIIKKIITISKCSNTFIINDNYIILSIPDISNVEAGDDNDLVITTSAKTYRGRIAISDGTYIILDEVGQNIDPISLPLIPQSGPLYSPFGIYQRADEYEVINANVYKIYGNYVLFPQSKQLEIYESFGDYIAFYRDFANVRRICVGIVTINRQSKPVKPAARN